MAVVCQAQKCPDKPPWVAKLLGRMSAKQAAIAIADQTARMAIMVHGGVHEAGHRAPQYRARRARLPDQRLGDGVIAAAATQLTLGPYGETQQDHGQMVLPSRRVVRWYFAKEASCAITCWSVDSRQAGNRCMAHAPVKALTELRPSLSGFPYLKPTRLEVRSASPRYPIAAASRVLGYLE